MVEDKSGTVHFPWSLSLNVPTKSHLECSESEKRIEENDMKNVKFDKKMCLSQLKVSEQKTSGKRASMVINNISNR